MKPPWNFFVLFWHLYERRTLTREPGLVISPCSPVSGQHRRVTEKPALRVKHMSALGQAEA